MSRIHFNPRTAFVSGLLLLAPIGATAFVVSFLLRSVGEPTRQFFFFFLPPEIWDNPFASMGLSIAAMAIVVAMITLLGWFSQYVLGKLLVQAFDRGLARVPVLSVVYTTVKQIVDTFTQSNKAVFQSVVLVEFPRKGLYAIGFVTNRAKGEIQERTRSEVINVFIPTTPNPTSGYLCMVPVEDAVDLDMTVAEGMKLIISGGAVVPPWPPRPRPGAPEAPEPVALAAPPPAP